MTAARIGRALERGELVGDHAFDALLDPAARSVSSMYWTPIDVARRAARWLSMEGAHEVLDVGAGAGKFCVVTALTSPLRACGIEQRARLVRTGREVARAVGVEDRVRLLCGTIEELELAAYDALYLFNPFAENGYGTSHQLDDSVELSIDRLIRDVAYVERALLEAPVGMMVATYYGFGGRIPDTFVKVREEPAGSDVLRLWRKQHEAPRGHSWVEVDDEVALISNPAADRLQEASLGVLRAWTTRRRR